MTSPSYVLPWFSPKLSQSMSGVMNGLGHAVTYRRGEIIYEAPGFFSKLMFVRRGVVAKALLDVERETTLFWSASGPGTLCGSYESLYLPDHMPRRHWCMTTTEVLVVNAELLLRIADQNSDWQRELSNYSSLCSLADRTGMIVNHALPLEERLGAFYVLFAAQFDRSFFHSLADERMEWLALETPPARRAVAGMLSTSIDNIRKVLNGWQQQDVLRIKSHKLLLSRARFLSYWRSVAAVVETMTPPSRLREPAAQTFDAF